MLTPILPPVMSISPWSGVPLTTLCHERVLQRDIESHNKIVNAVLKLSERLAAQGSHSGGKPGLKEEREQDCLQLVALNLQRRWHGIWIQSLEWQCRLEDALTRRKIEEVNRYKELTTLLCPRRTSPKPSPFLPSLD
ncbi:A kinase (PRKA) anchor protein 6 [Plakobranchus ocellatus]|uniref:A kinase (PRKA) anchor protein 6 n=1 Tax=Plakobranchus ocellatus TaxID=259542 RepID=A0AAV4AAN1_9GAST|nr:A kinase (PRKA) anchor protein 6 [Plakobranchus ocellatus]